MLWNGRDGGRSGDGVRRRRDGGDIMCYDTEVV